MMNLNRLRVILRGLACFESWTLPPRVTRALLESLRLTRPASARSGTWLHPYCPPVGTRAYRRYLRGLKRLSRGEQIPLVAHISITDQCPNHCARCSNISNSTSPPSLQQLKTLLSELRAAGTACVAFTGGEPLLRDDLAELIAVCAPDMATILFSSGHRLTPERAKLLRQTGLGAAYVSLDHFEAEPHDRGRGRVGAWARSRRPLPVSKRV